MGEFEALDNFILEKVSESKLPGLAIAAVKDGEVVHKRGYGFRDISSGQAATPETLYCIGSVTKSFTCIAIMQLQEKGLLSVEDDVEKHVPMKLRSRDEPVKIWHLMSHTSGVPALAYAEAVIRHTMKSADVWLPLVNFEDMFTFMDGAERWAHTRPGERWFYLNEGYRLLGYIIETISGEKYEDYVGRHILEPLGMGRSFFSKLKIDGESDVATPYIVTRDGERIPSTYPYGIVSSDGGLVSSVVDMAEYIAMYLNGGKCDGGRLLREDSLREMMKRRVKTPDEPFITKHSRYYGYGLGINTDFFGHQVISHGGSVSTATAQMAFIPEKKVGVMVLANGTGYPLSYIGEYALALLLGENPKQLTVVSYEAVQRDLEGVYETYKGTMRSKVVRRGSLLSLEMGDKYRDVTVPLVPIEWQGPIKIFHGISMDRKYPVEFYTENEEKFLIYERYKMRKIGKI